MPNGPFRNAVPYLGHAYAANANCSRSTTTKKYGASSIFCNGSYAPINAGVIAASGDWTGEAWVMSTGGSTGQFTAFSLSGSGFSASQAVVALALSSGTVTNVILRSGGSAKITASGFTSNAWHHVAVTRSGSTVTLWVDGVAKGTTSVITSIDGAYPSAIGCEVVGNGGVFNFPLTGYVDDFRFTVGVARYTADFSASLPTEFSDTGVGDPYWSSVTAQFSGEIADPSVAVLPPAVYSKQAFAPSWPVAGKLPSPGPLNVRNVYHGGRGRIAGTVKVKGTPNYAVYRKVRLYRERDGICVAEQWSDPITGNYSFDYWDRNEKYTVVSYDYTNNFRAVIADNITPDLIP